MIIRMLKAQQDGDSEFVVWGTGSPKREFMHVDDLAKACVYINSINKQKYYKLIISEFKLKNKML